MKKLIIISFALLITSSVFTQTVIKGEIAGASLTEMTLAEHFGERTKVIDTIKTDISGSFKYTLPEKAPKGLYRLYITNKNWIKLILGWEDIEFSTLSKIPVSSMSIEKGLQNKALYRFIKVSNTNKRKVSALTHFLSDYPDEDKLKQTAREKLRNIYKKEQNILDSLNKRNPESFVSRYLQFIHKEPFNSFSSRNPENRINAINNKDWNDTLLLNSDAYSKTLFEYLMLHRKRNISKEQQIELFKDAIDSLFAKIPEENPVYDYAMMYYLQGFERLNQESLIMHIVEEYAEKCNRTKGNLKNRISFYQKFQKGTKLPDFVITDLNEKPQKFYDHITGKTILIFWASWCGHCKMMNQRLKNLHPKLKKNNIQVISVSLDNSPEKLNEYLENNNLPWKVWCDYNGWDSPLVDKFSLYATPTMFFIDEDYKIIGKPLNINQLLQLINI